MSNKKEVIYFDKVIPAGQTLEFTSKVKDDGTIEKLTVKFYIGQEKGLRVIPTVIHNNNQPEALITYPTGTEQYLSGDDDYFDFPIVVPVALNDVIKLKAINTDSTYDYHLTAAITIDYYAGQNRVIAGVV